MIDFALLARSMRVSNLAYMDPGAAQTAALKSIGLDLVGRFDSDDCHITIAREPGQWWVTIAGTHFTDADDVEQWKREFGDNIDARSVKIGNLGIADEGYYGPLAELWPSVQRTLPAVENLSDPVRITGHSMGGVRAHLCRLLFAPETNCEVISFGAPKGADATFWQSIYGTRPPLRVVCEADFAPTWPEFGPFGQPGPMLWFHGGTAETVDVRHGIEASVPNHMPDFYQATLDALAAEPQPKAA